MSMRGLTVFIADIRNCRVREMEEKRINKEMANIRSKFKEGRLDGYSKKKYVCKLLYMYILGWEIDFGHMEAVNLISSPKYSEKQIGYLAVTLLFHENSDLVRLVVNSIKKDLDNMNEINQCLALHAIANIGGREMAESLATDVHRLLISPTSKSFVQKKAALTLLRLYRKHADVIPAQEWAERIIALMSSYDLGVGLSVTTLVMALAQNYPNEYFGCYEKAILVDRDYSLEYIYYKIPTPWLQVKLLRLLQYYPPTEDPHLFQELTDLLQHIIANSQDTPKNIQHNNAQNAVLFEAISLAIHLDSNSSICAQAAVLLGRFISSKETNVRYLGLEAMAHLAACVESLEPIKKHQDTIIMSLRDKDISVRRRALDLLYSMCDMTNSKIIVSELLRYLQIADYGLREELVLKIAILTEKFATEYSWYVDIILQLISSAGDHVGEEVWFRVVQIVTNNEDLQEYTAKTVLNYLVSPQYNETMIKVGSYILGEFGHLIANMPGCSPIEQFNAVQSKFALCSPQTRALILSTYIKFVNLFPEIKGEILGVFDQYRHVLDSELQQRACEYLSIATMPTEDVLQTVCEEMPPFPERESTLLLKLNEKQGDTEDKRTWSIGGKEANMERVEQLRKISQRSNSSDSIKGISSGEIKPATQPTPVPKPTSALEDLLGLGDLSLNGSTNGNGHVTASDVLTPGYEPGYRALQYTTEGTLYENGLLQVNLKSEYHGHLGRVALFYHNRTAHELTHFAVTLESMEGLNIMTPNLPPTVLSPQSQLQQLFNIECNALLDDSPQITIVFATQQSGVQTIKLKLPIVLTNFMEPIVAMDGTSFFQRWKQIGGPPLEAQVIFGLQRPIDLAKVRHVIEGLRFALLEGVDTNPQNIVGAGVVHAGSAGKVGTLLRLEPNVEQQMFRLTLRTTSDVVSEKVREIVQNALTYS